MPILNEGASNKPLEEFPIIASTKFSVDRNFSAPNDLKYLALFLFFLINFLISLIIILLSVSAFGEVKIIKVSFSVSKTDNKFLI